ncbi:hypothetical protein D3C73_1062420 [compost metagenome]
MIKPRRSRNVHCELVGPLRIIAPIPDPAPGRPAVGAAEDHLIRPPGVQAGDHQGIRMLGIDRQTAEAIPVIVSSRRANVGPGTACGIVFPHLAFTSVIRANPVAVGNV